MPHILIIPYGTRELTNYGNKITVNRNVRIIKLTVKSYGKSTYVQDFLRVRVVQLFV